MNIPKRLIILLLILGVGSFGALGYFAITAYHRVDTSAVTNCEEIELVKGAVRATIEQAQKFVSTSHVRSKPEKQKSETYYTEVLNRFSPRNCHTERKRTPHARNAPRKAHPKQ